MAGPGQDGPARESLLSPIGPRGPVCRRVIDMSVQSLITQGLQSLITQGLQNPEPDF